MGAFISYLYMIGKSRNFFVLAPNLTIYEKLLADFQPTSPKYVFRGIEAFAHQAPLIVNAENYEEGRGVRGVDLFGREGAIINIFNISKINSEVRGGNSPRIKRLQEYIGDSYFAYLSGLDDLVLLMDEAHRYRASAGAKAIAELKPILGLEVTATPKSVGAKSAEFKNVVFRYELPDAMEDGYVKEPAVGTRANFDPKSVDEATLERIKLEDGVNYHEHVRVTAPTPTTSGPCRHSLSTLSRVVRRQSHASNFLPPSRPWARCSMRRNRPTLKMPQIPCFDIFVRPYEDALILANLADFEIADDADAAINAWETAQDFKKSEEAIKYAIREENWNVPRYLREGLAWLSEPPPPPEAPPPIIPDAEPEPEPEAA